MPKGEVPVRAWWALALSALLTAGCGGKDTGEGLVAAQDTDTDTDTDSDADTDADADADADADTDTDTDTDTGTDLTERLGEDEARAGVVTDPDALFGGAGAEGRPGDIKIYNDRVQFIIQGARDDGHFLARQGGCVIDADVVRPEGQPGRDPVQEWAIMAGFGHLPDPTSVTVTADGSDGGAAVVTVEAPETAMEYLVGALESESLIPDQGLVFTIEYRLEPGSWLMEVTTTLTATDGDVLIDVGDAIVSAQEVVGLWMPGHGVTDGYPSTFGWSGLLGHRNEIAVGVFAEEGEALQSSLLIGGLGSLMAVAPGFTPIVEITEGSSFTLRRYYGAGPDLATLTDAWLEATGEASDVVTGTVSASDGPVAGARVTVSVDGAPWTLAVTDAEGAFEARVPAGSEVTTLADGRGPGVHLDLPEGHAPYSPYAAQPARDAALASLAGAPAVALSQGRGFGSELEPLVLAAPGTLVVRSADGLPFEVRATMASEPAVPAGLVQPRTAGLAALGWARDGEVSMAIEPGVVDLVVHRGSRYEVFTATVEVLEGESHELDVDLPLAYSTPGWLVADPHMHAATSPDGKITMSERLIGAAASGIQLHFGTDHDHVVDYGPLVTSLGLDSHLATVVACEVSPVLRGHLNVYPLTSDDTEPNGGAWLWFQTLFEDTAEAFGLLRAHHPDALIQVNHPFSGLSSFADWSPGVIGDVDFWSDDFDVLEVLNAGNHDPFALYLDLVSRGIVPAPSGVSDSHGHTSGSPGVHTTFIDCGTDDPAACDPSALVDAFSDRATVVSSGPFLDLSIRPGSTVTGSATLDVEALSPSWIRVDRLLLYQDNALVASALGSSATFDLAPAVDAAFVVVAEGDTPMQPVTGSTPWAMSAAILVDVAGDGWEPPLPPLSL